MLHGSEEFVEKVTPDGIRIKEYASAMKYDVNPFMYVRSKEYSPTPEVNNSIDEVVIRLEQYTPKANNASELVNIPLDRCPALPYPVLPNAYTTLPEIYPDRDVQVCFRKMDPNVSFDKEFDCEECISQCQ